MLRLRTCRPLIAWALWGLLAALLCAVPGTGRAAPGTALPEDAPRELRYAISHEPGSLDLHQESDPVAVALLGPYYSLLLRRDPQNPLSGQLVGEVAARWSAGDGQRQWTFTLYPDFTFWDDSPLTAEDVAASFRHIIFPPAGVRSPRRHSLNHVTAVTALDEVTVRFTLSRSDAQLPRTLSSPFNVIYRAAALAADPHGYETRVLGSGPFQLVQHLRGTEWRGVAFEDHPPRGRAQAPGIRTLVQRGEAQRVQLLRDGLVHALFEGLSPGEADFLEQQMSGALIVQRYPAECLLLAIPDGPAPMTDVRVRRALNLALNRQVGAQRLSRLTVMRWPGALVPPEDPRALPPDRLRTLEGFSPDIAPRRALARSLLAQAGVPVGYHFDLLAPNLGQPWRTAANWLVDQWRQIGLSPEADFRSPAEYEQVRRVNSLWPRVVLIQHCTDSGDAITSLGALLALDGDRLPPRAAAAVAVDANLAGLWREAQRTPNLARRQSLIGDLQGRLIDGAYVIPTFWTQRIALSTPKLRGWKIQPSAQGNPDLASLALMRP